MQRKKNQHPWAKLEVVDSFHHTSLLNAVGKILVLTLVKQAMNK